MYTNIPYMVEGEIVSVQPSPMAQKKNVVRYLCLVDMPNGSRILIPNVIASTVIGGIDDYFQVRSRTSTDSGEEFPTIITTMPELEIGYIFPLSVGISLNL